MAFDTGIPESLQGSTEQAHKDLYGRNPQADECDTANYCPAEPLYGEYAVV